MDSSLLYALLVIWIIFEWALRILALFVVPRNRRPNSGMSWILFIALVPVIGWVGFLIFGSSKLPKNRRDAQNSLDRYIVQAIKQVSDQWEQSAHLLAAKPPEKYANSIELGSGLTHLPLFAPAFFGSAFGIFLLRQYFLTVPQDLNDAAKIDGCNHFGVYWRIIMPLSKPVLATLGLLAFMGSWNDLLGPIIYLYDGDLFTLPLALTRFRGQYYTQWAYMMAGATVSLLPILLIFLFTQKYFVRGVVLSGLKG